ncbi:cytochrome P460 family protein [Methylocaldum szegediense]|uniref:Cytochrome P460 n=1 Tax=Methylocaldum szegediense TaxID=73780 RepID=A0ABN8XDV7_9GAMM|nr:cytochrome P460 family protein [Methylocaldum szegediense]CAI8965001.1 Cytochrome P460 [Methylocaldum szegediense]
MNKHIISMAAIGILNLCFAGAAWSEEAKVKYPEGYRDWTHVKSMVIEQGHPLYDSFGGIHHIYANDKALKALKEGGSHPDGSVLIFDLLEAKKENNAIVEGNRKVLGVMEKDSQKFKETGGWGFEGFKGDTQERVVTDPKTACFSCHEPQKQSDYVYSTYRK